jgi:hypothetical protein
MSEPTYTELEQTARLLFASYVRTIAAIQDDWSEDAPEDATHRVLSALFSTLAHDAPTVPDLDMVDVVRQLRQMSLVSDDQTASS